MSDETNVISEQSNLSKGQVRLVMPREVSIDDVNFLEYWFSGLLMRLKTEAGFEPDEIIGLKFRMPLDKGHIPNY